MPLIREVMTVTIPIVPWVGGKRRLADVLTPRFFCAHSCYVEVFAGAAVRFLRPPAELEVLGKTSV